MNCHSIHLVDLFHLPEIICLDVSKPPSMSSKEGLPAKRDIIATLMGDGDGGFGPPPVAGNLFWLFTFLAKKYFGY